MESHVPLISVVITAYNRPDYLKTSVQSVLAQTFRDYEIIVVDDCSPTSLKDTLDEFDFPIRYHRMPHNGGANRARNQGIELARGRYIAFLDDDDAWIPEKLNWQLAAMQGATACIGGYEYLDTRKPFVKPIRQVTESMLKKGNPYCGMSGLICERSWLLDNPFDEALANAQDWDIYVRLARQAPIAYVPQSLFLYRRGSHDSITTKVKRMSLADIEKRLGATIKHRDWLGERYYRLRVAHMILGYIGNRPDPLKFVLFAMRKGGLLATATVLAEKLGNFMKRGGKVTSH